VIAKPIKELIKDVLFGPIVPQVAWKTLHSWALRGMNIGGGSSVTNSGELWVLDRLAPLLLGGGPAVVFDVGANVGNYALRARERLGAGVELYCFEPSQVPYSVLASRTASVPGVRAFQLGLSDKEELVTLYTTASHTELASLYERKLDHIGVSLSNREQIRLTTVDRFCAEHDIRRIRLLKLDCEGHELKVLSGASEMLSSGAIDTIQFEFGGCNIDSRTYLRDFFDVLAPRYKLYRILRKGLAPLAEYREDLEVFTTTNYLAVLASFSIEA
jgi:FkbM family methyltransferase